MKVYAEDLQRMLMALPARPPQGSRYVVTPFAARVRTERWGEMPNATAAIHNLTWTFDAGGWSAELSF